MLEIMEAKAHDDIIYIAEVAMKMTSSCALVEGLGTRLNVGYLRFMPI